MTELLLDIGLSNLLMALPLALLAWVLQGRCKSPVIVYLLWLLVLLKLLTPPLLQLPLIPDLGLGVGPPAPLVVPSELPGSVLAAAPAAADPSMGISMALGLAWLAGSLVALVLSLWRIVRFDQLLRRASRPAGQSLNSLARELGQGLGLRRMPLVATTKARIVPLVWWTPWARRPRIVLPETMTRELAVEDLRWVLAHELAHVRRRDYVVRWFEWLGCVAVWWNPIYWLARRNLRLSEELCCDALVLERLRPVPRSYADSLLSAIEHLAASCARPPALASALSSGGQLEWRLRSIVEGRVLNRVTRGARSALLALVVVILPWGLAGSVEAEPLIRADLASLGEPSTGGLKPGELARKVHARGIPRARVPLLVGCIEGLAATLRAQGRGSGEPQLYKRLALEHGLMKRELGIVIGLAELLARYDPSSQEEGTPGSEPTRVVRGSYDLRETFAQMGIEGAAFDGIEASLVKVGVHPKALPHALGALGRIIHEVRAEGSEFVLNKRLQIFLKSELRLTKGQIERTIGLARRLAKS